MVGPLPRRVRRRAGARGRVRRMIEWGVAIGVVFAVVLAVARPALVSAVHRRRRRCEHLAAAGAAGSSRSLQPLSRGGVRARRHPHRRRRPALPRGGDARGHAARLRPGRDRGRPCSTVACSGSGPRSRSGSWPGVPASAWRFAGTGWQVTGATAPMSTAVRPGHRARASSDRGRGAQVPSADERSAGATSRRAPRPSPRSGTGSSTGSTSGPDPNRRAGGRSWTPGGELVPVPAVRAARTGDRWSTCVAATSTRGVGASRSARSRAGSTTRSTATGSAPSGRASSTSRCRAARCSSPTTAARSRPTRP